MCHSFIKVDQDHHVPYIYLFGVLYSNACYETKTHDIDGLQKHLIQTWFDFDRDIIDAAIDRWHDHLKSCVCVCVCVLVWTV